MKRFLKLGQPQMSTSMALMLAAAFMLVPANLLPVMHLAAAGAAPQDLTIFAGVKSLAESGLWYLAVIVFVASIVVPVVKIGGLTVLLLAAYGYRPRSLTRIAWLHPFLEAIGPWSMLDVFAVGFLSGAVRFGVLGSVEPRAGIISFAGAVVLTLLATHAYDPHWLEMEPPHPKSITHEAQAH